jgi:hypothetical protein
MSPSVQPKIVEQFHNIKRLYARYTLNQILKKYVFLFTNPSVKRCSSERKNIKTLIKLVNYSFFRCVLT